MQALAIVEMTADGRAEAFEAVQQALLSAGEPPTCADTRRLGSSRDKIGARCHYGFCGWHHSDVEPAVTR